MQKKQIPKKIITSLVLLGIVLMPFSFTKKAEAQNVSAYMTGIAPAVAALPLCRTATKSALKTLFLPGHKEKKEQAEAAKKEAAAEKKRAELAADAALTVPVGLQDGINRSILNSEELNKDTNKKVSATEENDTCLKSIGRLVIKMLLQKMTLATVDWINNGFNGGPAFVQDPGQFFGDIAKNEILQFGAEINNPDLFPFGRAFMENQARAFQNKFADNARYSLNELIKNTTPEYSAETFSADFSQGGWDAWTYMTQVPANNPLGFQIMASNELQKRLEGTEQSNAQNIRDSLKESGGFLGDYRCADPGDYITQEEHQKALEERSASSTGPYQYELCKRWEYVTPGGMIAKAATDTVKYPENSLLKADDLNDAVAAIIDALINRFSNDIMTKGFANVSNDLPSGASAGIFIPNEDNYTSYGVSKTSEDYPDYIIEASSWLKQNPDFNIRSDLNQALIDEQRTYVDKLGTQNKELNDLIAVTRQLDYCIPGPHPGWEEDSLNKLNETLNKIPSYDDSVNATDVLGSAASVSAQLGQIFPGFGTFAQAYGLFTSIFGSSGDDSEQKYYATIVDGFTGIQPNANGKIGSMQQAHNILNIILERYGTIIHQIYDQNPYMPLVTIEAKNEFLKIPGYQKIIDENTKKMSTLKGIANRLASTKTEIDNLNKKLTNNVISQEEYDKELQPFINSFGRMSADMVSGDNISNVDNIMKQAKDKKTYIYNDLLKGPAGCEQDLSTGEAIHLPWQFFEAKRMTYPFPILYDYNILGAGDIIPDPWGSGYTNHMISGFSFKINNTGPGFLTNTIYSRDDGLGAASTTSAQSSWLLLPEQFPYLTSPSNHPGVLTLFEDPDDTSPTANERLIDRGGSHNVGVGKNTGHEGRFERMIGIY